MVTVEKAAFEQVIAAAREAGEAVLDEYERPSATRSKSDGSPVSEADERSQEIILAQLAHIAPGVPVVAEEGTQAHAAPLDGLFWLVDPLDGTKEFLDRTDEFTVNIALIENRAPVLGVVLAPARGLLFAAAPQLGASVEDGVGRRSIVARSNSAVANSRLPRT